MGSQVGVYKGYCILFSRFMSVSNTLRLGDELSAWLPRARNG